MFTLELGPWTQLCQLSGDFDSVFWCYGLLSWIVKRWLNDQCKWKYVKRGLLPTYFVTSGKDLGEISGPQMMAPRQMLSWLYQNHVGSFKKNSNAMPYTKHIESESLEKIHRKQCFIYIYTYLYIYILIYLYVFSRLSVKFVTFMYFFCDYEVPCWSIHIIPTHVKIFNSNKYIFLCLSFFFLFKRCTKQ